MVLDFLDNLPLPSTNTVRVCDAEILSEQLASLAADLIIPELTKKHLMRVKQSLVIAELERDNRTPSNFNKTGAKMAMLEVEKKHDVRAKWRPEKHGCKKIWRPHNMVAKDDGGQKTWRPEKHDSQINMGARETWLQRNMAATKHGGKRT
ncbi:unnamed protein product, partial [Timema podura]|nr:unnamed protein product [Timema podura]